MRFCILLFLFLFLSSCFQVDGEKSTGGDEVPVPVETVEVLTNEVLDTEVEEFEEGEEDSPRRKPGSCREIEYEGEELEINEDIDYIDSRNVNQYTINGRCDRRGDLIEIEVNGYALANNPYCSGGRWEVTINLSTILDNEDEYISFRVTDPNESLCVRVRVDFSRPNEDGYLAIPSLFGVSDDERDDENDSLFYVMKYEAKNSKGRAVSDYEDRPATGLSLVQAKKLCQSNGARYDLINNHQWQRIALNIESVNQNWSEGRASALDNNQLNCGNATGYPKEASRRDSDDCASSSCGKNYWHEDRRTHLLSTGEYIWDMCGNAGEMVRDAYRTIISPRSLKEHSYALKGALKRVFGPKRNYGDAGRYNNYWGLGYVDIEKSDSLIVRGGGRISGRNYPGVFSATSDNAGRPRSNVGFRCVYNP